MQLVKPNTEGDDTPLTVQQKLEWLLDNYPVCLSDFEDFKKRKKEKYQKEISDEEVLVHFMKEFKISNDTMDKGLQSKKKARSA